MSLNDLLGWFVHPDYKSGGLSRISDMHVKVGRPVSFRIDDDLQPLPEGFNVETATMETFLRAILSGKHQNVIFGDTVEDVIPVSNGRRPGSISA